ncbi:hypothetical protein CYLTODRAFT_491699 [Cylindrobasidium torrendii FP15055 ss-10]|uniref:Uncharacterized protein n=1 Tax=Cylindrobasidium torrendii FP15055 ss-10 TaxID=1314674 RepID=A0A0D7B6R9_9AGAR|nr:hypothetical protein CYLTODRAFT_491699 [Cylindrobasidium torrendii FP15055 ss-10]
MLRSPSDSHDDHVRMLLDQRATRADLHSRMPSFSEYSDTDTPSMYSKAFFSPRPSEDTASFSSPTTYRDRNRMNELAVSMLDLEGDDDEADPRASFLSSSTYAEDILGDYAMSDDEQAEEPSPIPRMSMLGPKMRYHSKAPWEMDERPLTEEPEQHPASAYSRPDFGASSLSLTDSHHSSSGSESRSKRSFESTYTRASSAVVSAVRAPFGRSPAPPTSPLLLPTRRRALSPESIVSDDEPTLTRILPNRHSDDSVESAHPYANPSNASFNYPSQMSSFSFPHSESAMTVTDSPHGKSMRTQTAPLPVTPTSPTRSVFKGKEISSPLSMHHASSSHPTNVVPEPSPTSVPGWMDKGTTSPNFNLISLEEARAQRSRTSTTQAPSFEPDHSGSTSSGTSRARARSISAGARAKQAISHIVSGQPTRQEELPSSTPASPGRTLKNKRSGFLRLFNGREEKTPPPPVPPLADSFAPVAAPKPVKPSPNRVPVPSLSPSPLGSSGSSMKRSPPPPLTLDKTSPVIRGPSTGLSPSDVPRPFATNGSPQSAPANVTEFPSLSLRPVSTAFSAQFGDIIADSHDILSPTTPSSAASIQTVSPTTSFGPSHYIDVPSIVTSCDDQSSVIRALQDQINTARKSWQRSIWELEGQVRDLKSEVETLRTKDSGEYCAACGRGHKEEGSGHDAPKSVVNRPRARTGTGQSRFGNSAA